MQADLKRGYNEIIWNVIQCLVFADTCKGSLKQAVVVTTW